MSKISPKISNAGVTWDSNGRVIAVQCENPKFSLYNQENRLIYVICCDYLIVYTEDGVFLCELPPPKDFEFYYLLPYDSLGVSVVCSTKNKEEIHPDWHFKFDDDKKELVRHCPAR